MFTFYLESLGCPKNQVDSEIMIASLEAIGIRQVPEPDPADLIIVNTCGFITPAKEESIEYCLGIKDKFPGKLLIMAGCLSQRYGSELPDQLPEVDGFHFSREPEGITQLVGDLIAPRGFKARDPQPVPAYPRRTKLLSYPRSVYIKIADGCANMCSYCAIPVIKGNLASRPRGEIFQEIEAFLGRGIYEFNLVAQDLASYGADRGGSELPDLLREIGGLNGDFWLRLLYLHPDRFPMEILGMMRKDPRVLPYFDIPLQHASGSVLRAMGRKGSSDTYLELVRRIRDSVPNAVIRSTFLVGFPGETESDFESLMDFQSRAQLDWLGIFVYSPEEGTPAFKMDGSVRRETAEERRSCLERAQIAITNRRLDRLVGESFPVLIEEPVLKEDYYLGRGYPHAPDVDGLVLLKGRGFKSGDLVPARILKRNGFDLEAVSERDHGKITG